MTPVRKYLAVCCAVCGRFVRGKGWFCSYRCDTYEYNARFAANKALFEARGGNDPAVLP